MLVALTRAELKDTRDLSVVGLLKWMLEPLVSLGVYVVLVAGVFEHQQPAYPLFVLIALIPFRYFSNAITTAMTVVASYGRMIATYPLPRGVLPLVPLLSQGVSFLVSLLLIIPFAVYYDTGLSPNLLWVPVVVVALAFLTAGPAYLGTLFGLYLPDYRGVAQSLLRLLFLASTGLVALGRIPGDRLPTIFRANPLSSIFDALRSIVIQEQAPSLGQLLYPLAVGTVLLAIGWSLYRWRESEVPKEV